MHVQSNEEIELVRRSINNDRRDLILIEIDAKRRTSLQISRMFKIKPIVFLLLSSILAGCAAGPYRRQGPDRSGTLSSNWIPVYWVGMRTGDTKDGKLVIVQVSSDSPVQTAGMHAGDVITAVNGRKMSNEEFYAFMHFNRGENVSFKTKRNGVETEHAVQPEKIFSAPPSTVKVKEMLYIDRRKVRIAVIVGDVRNGMEGNFDRRSWEASVRHQHQDQIENELLRNFADAKNFSLVARRRLDAILDEHTVRLSGSASEVARTHIGKTTGATHLLIANIARHPESRHGNYCVDEYHQQLIDIESGQVLAIDHQENEACR